MVPDDCELSVRSLTLLGVLELALELASLDNLETGFGGRGLLDPWLVVDPEPETTVIGGMEVMEALGCASPLAVADRGGDGGLSYSERR